MYIIETLLDSNRWIYIIKEQKNEKYPTKEV